MNLARALGLVVMIFVFFWRLMKKDYEERMMVFSFEALTINQQLREKMESGSPLFAGLNEEGPLLADRLCTIGLDSSNLKIPEKFLPLHEPGGLWNEALSRSLSALFDKLERESKHWPC